MRTNGDRKRRARKQLALSDLEGRASAAKERSKRQAVSSWQISGILCSIISGKAGNEKGN